MTRITTIIALTCFLVFGATAASILGRDSVPGARLEMAAASLDQSPVSNKAAKQDKLEVAATFALASFGPPQEATLSEPLRQAFASTAPVDMVPPQIHGRAEAEGCRQAAAAGTKILRAAQRRADRRHQGAAQAFLLARNPTGRRWKPRCAALPARSTRPARPIPSALIDPDAEEVQQLKSAAMPLLFQLREDQKREVRTLARIIGLEKVASMI